MSGENISSQSHANTNVLDNLEVVQHLLHLLRQLLHAGILVVPGQGCCSVLLTRGVDVEDGEAGGNLPEVRIVEECLVVGDVVEAEVVVGDDDWLVVGDLLTSVSHQHSPCARLYIRLSVVIALTQTPEKIFARNAKIIYNNKIISTFQQDLQQPEL